MFYLAIAASIINIRNLFGLLLLIYGYYNSSKAFIALFEIIEKRHEVTRASQSNSLSSGSKGRKAAACMSVLTASSSIEMV